MKRNPVAPAKPPATLSADVPAADLPVAGTSPQRTTGSAAGDFSEQEASPGGFRGEGPGRAYQTDGVAPCSARPVRTVLPPNKPPTRLGQFIGIASLRTLAFWTGEVIGAACLFIILFGGLFIGAALQ